MIIPSNNTNSTYINGFADGYKQGQKDEQKKWQTPCDLCVYNPPSSFDGKPCTICVAEPYKGES